MKSSTIQSLLAAAAISMMGAGGGAAHTIAASAPEPRSKRPGRQSKATGMGYRRRGAAYPEQSSRQAMRGHRRQQGGPGIVLNNKNIYEAAAA